MPGAQQGRESRAGRPLRAVLGLLCLAAAPLRPRAAPCGRATQGHRHQQRCRSHRDHRLRRGLGRARRRAADRHRGRRRRRHADACPCRAATPGTNPAWFVFALTNATDKPIERWLTADRYGTVGLGHRVAGSRCASRRAGHALGRLRAGAREERPRRRVPHLAGPRPDRDVRRRARRRPLNAPLSVEARRVRAEEPGPASSSTASCWASPACSPSS